MIEQSSHLRHRVQPTEDNSAHAMCSTSVGLLLGQRRRRWANIGPTLGQRFVFAASC